jgi:DNA mismatch endonuclease, patch repair protein
LISSQEYKHFGKHNFLSIELAAGMSANAARRHWKKVLAIWNERVAGIRKRYRHLRTVVLVKSNDLLELAVFEFDTIYYSPDDYSWAWNKRNNLEGGHKTSSKHKFTWQPHGSQFTIIEDVPKNRLAFRLKQPPQLDRDAILKTLNFDASWVQIIKWVFMDTFSPQKRSAIMRRVRSVNTRPEMKVRSLLHRLGFRFRLHRKELPGNPDIVLPKYRAVIFVHGCFWHRHPGCPQASTPATRREYWLPKFRRTVERDRTNQDELRELGWNVLIIWECEIRKPEELACRIKQALIQKPVLYPIELAEVKLVAENPDNYEITPSSRKWEISESYQKRFQFVYF